MGEGLHHMKRRQAAISSIAVAAVLLAAGMASATGSERPSPDTITIDGIQVDASTGVRTAVELDAFLTSDTPKMVQVERTTGGIISVTEGLPVTPLTVVHNPCQSGDACLYPSSTPLATYGFSGVGTSKGKWYDRKTWCTGSWTAKAWYLYNSTLVGWGTTFGPNTCVGINNPVMAAQVTIYS